MHEQYAMLSCVFARPGSITLCSVCLNLQSYQGGKFEQVVLLSNATQRLAKRPALRTNPLMNVHAEKRVAGEAKTNIRLQGCHSHLRAAQLAELPCATKRFKLTTIVIKWRLVVAGAANAGIEVRGRACGRDYLKLSSTCNCDAKT